MVAFCHCGAMAFGSVNDESEAELNVIGGHKLDVDMNLLHKLNAICDSRLSNQLKKSAVYAALQINSEVSSCTANAVAGSGASPLRDLENVYFILGDATGIEMKKTSRANALLKVLGLEQFCSRFSKLSSRRKLSAHPDSMLTCELSKALERLGPKAISTAAEKFRAHGADSANENDKESDADSFLSTCEIVVVIGPELFDLYSNDNLGRIC